MLFQNASRTKDLMTRGDVSVYPGAANVFAPTASQAAAISALQNRPIEEQVKELVGMSGTQKLSRSLRVQRKKLVKREVHDKA